MLELLEGCTVVLRGVLELLEGCTVVLHAPLHCTAMLHHAGECFACIFDRNKVGEAAGAGRAPGQCRATASTRPSSSSMATATGASQPVRGGPGPGKKPSLANQRKWARDQQLQVRLGGTGGEWWRAGGRGTNSCRCAWRARGGSGRGLVGAGPTAAGALGGHRGGVGEGWWARDQLLQVR